MSKSCLQTLKPNIATINVSRGAPVATERIRDPKARKAIMHRDKYTCQICGRLTAHGEVDHVVPLAVGGSNAPLNLQYLCKDCHKAKTEKEQKDRGPGKS